MSIEDLPAEKRVSAPSRLSAHLVGFLGANFVCLALLVWGLEVSSWLGVAAPPSPLARFLGIDNAASVTAIHLSSALLCLGAGLALIGTGARLLVLGRSAA